jgi:hypothetical protein
MFDVWVDLPHPSRATKSSRVWLTLAPIYKSWVTGAGALWIGQLVFAYTPDATLTNAASAVVKLENAWYAAMVPGVKQTLEGRVGPLSTVTSISKMAGDHTARFEAAIAQLSPEMKRIRDEFGL